MDYLNVDVLLAEDSPYDAELTMFALREVKIAQKIFHVKDGVDALDFIYGNQKFAGRCPGKGVKLILLDLKMPRVNGIQVLEKLKSDEQTKHIPVVVFSSSNEVSDIELCYAHGVNSYVVKPVEFDGFTKVLADLGNYWMMHNRVVD